MFRGALAEKKVFRRMSAMCLRGRLDELPTACLRNDSGRKEGCLCTCSFTSNEELTVECANPCLAYVIGGMLRHPMFSGSDRGSRRDSWQPGRLKMASLLLGLRSAACLLAWTAATRATARRRRSKRALERSCGAIASVCTHIHVHVWICMCIHI